MKQLGKQAFAVFLNIAVCSNQLLADLPPITFDSAEWVPYQTVGTNPASGWQLLSGDASVSPTGAGFNGGKALRLPVNPQQETKIIRTVPWIATDTTAFIDLKIKPAADPSGSLSSFFVNGTELAFQVPAGSSVGEIWVYHGKDLPATPSINPEQWVKTVGTFNVSGTTATAYQRVTLRHDYQRNLWDLFIEGKLAAVNLAFDGRSSNLTTLDFYGSRVGDTLIDDISALTTNMLFPDADKDGLPDAWEIANGSNPNLYDRDQLKPGTTTPFIGLYMDSLWPTGSVNGNAPIVTSGGIPPLSIIAAHQPVTAIKGSLSVGGDGSMNYSLPIDIPKGTAGMEPKISLNYSSSAGNGIAGIGWSIGGLQSITRGAASHAKDGFTGAVRFDQNDRFFFNGERLICVAGTYGSINSEYRTEIDSYARVTLLGGNQNSPASWWRVQTKAGLNIELGNTPDSKTIPNGPNAPISWDVSKVSDTVGNFYAVTWAGANSPLNRIFNRRLSSIAYTGNTGLAPYCFIDFNYEDRPDRSFAYHPTEIRFDSTQRLASVSVRTGTFINHTYRLTYQTTAQSGRSTLYSVRKEVPGGLSTAPTVFNWQGLAAGAPKWAKVNSPTLPKYNGSSDSSSGNNSVVTASNGTIKLSGDACRYTAVPGGVFTSLNSFIEFEFRAENPDSGSFLILDRNDEWKSPLAAVIGSNMDNFAVRIRSSSAINSSEFSFHQRLVAYTAALGTWQTLRVPIVGSSSNTTSPANVTYGNLALINENNNQAITGSWSEFRNIRVGTAAQLDGNQVAPLLIPEVQEIPLFTKGDSSSTGTRMMDVDSDGLIDLVDHRVVSWGTGSSINSMAARGQRGTVYRNMGNGRFDVAPDLMPGQDAILSDENDKWAYRHDLVSTPCDVDSDGIMDLLISDLRPGTNPATTSILSYKFKRFLNGAWQDYPAYQLPFESRNNSSSNSHGGQRHLAAKSFMDFDRDGYPDLLVTTSAVGWLAAPSPLLTLPLNLKLVPESSNAVYLNRVHLGQGWVKTDSLAPILPMSVSDGDFPEGVGRTLADLDGDGFMEFISSTAFRPNQAGWSDSRLCEKLIPPALPGNLPAWDFNTTTNTRRDYGKFWLPTAPYPPTSSFEFSLISNSNPPTPVDGNAPLPQKDPTGTFLIDVNGDGMTDVVRAYQRRFSFERRNGRFMQTVRNFERSHSTWFNIGRIPSNGQSCWERDASGHGFGYTLPVSLVGAGLDPWQTQNYNQFLDINGDGLVDILYSRDDGRYLGPLNSNLTSTERGNLGGEGARMVRVTDPLGGTNNGAFVNTGTGWAQDTSWGLPPGIRLGKAGYSQNAALLTDINGDGFPDIIGKVLEGQRPEIWLNQCKPEVITSVTDGFGSELQVEYSRLNDPNPTTGFGTRVYEKFAGTLPIGHSNIIDSRLVVSRQSEPNGAGGRTSKSQRYGDLRFDRTNESSLGFGWIEAKDELTGQISRTETSRVFPFGGSPVFTSATVPVTAVDLNATRLPGVTAGTKCLSTETAAYAELPSTTGVGGIIRRPVQTGSVKTLCDLKGNILSTTTTTQALADFDEFGFVKKSTVTSLDGTTVATTSNFSHNVAGANWLLGRLSSAAVTKSGGGKPTITKNSTFGYHPTTGLLTSETVEPGNPLSVTKSYVHDGFGNVTNSTVSASGLTRTATTIYDPSGRFVLAEKNGLNHTVTYNYDAQRSLLLSTTDIASNTSSFQYDPFGTLISTRAADGTMTGEITGWATNADLPAPIASQVKGAIKFFRAKQSSGTPIAKVYLDSMGRELLTETTILRNAASSSSSRYSKVYSVTGYDLRNRKSAVSDSFAAGEIPKITNIYYDFLNRVINTAHPDGTSEYAVTFDTRTINGQPTTYSKTRTRDGRDLERWEDMHGRIIQSSDPSAQITRFNHDHEGRLLNVFIDNQTLLTNTFDLFGNKTTVNEVNSGTSNSIYNGLGEVTSSTNARAQTTSFTYDSIGRPLSVIKPEGTFTTSYDGAPGNGIGQPWKTTGPSGYVEAVSYDSYGRAIASSKTQFGETFTTATTYDSLGRVASQRDAGGLTVINEYDSAFSFPLSSKIGLGSDGAGTVLWKAGTFDSKGRAITQTLAQGITATASYFPVSGLLNGLSATAPNAQLLQNSSCVWASNGNLTSRTDHIAKRVESFGYDSQNRVTSASTVLGAGAITTALPPPENFTYAPNGNLLSKGAATLTYGGSAVTPNARPHAVTSATIKGENRTYLYDAAGYVTSDSKRTYSWTSFGQLSALDYLSAPAIQTLAGIAIYAASRVQSNFSFDAGGNRAKQFKTRIAANDSRQIEDTLYLGSYEREISMSQATASSTPIVSKTLHRHTLAGLGVYTRSVSPTTGTAVKLSTILKDHLGSTDVIYTGTWNGTAFVNATTERQSFNTWGERRNADTWQNFRSTGSDPFRTSGTDYERGYTGHEQLDDSGLIHMNGRIYDPELGRMLSPDPFVQAPEYSQNFNRYSYVMNNPLNLTDPSGFNWWNPFSVHKKIHNWVKENWRTVAVIVVAIVLTYVTAGALAGAAYGVVGGTAFATGATATAASLTTLGAATVGGIVGGVVGGLNAALAGGSLGDVLRGAAVGAIQGAITGGVLGGLEQASGVFNSQTVLHVAGHGVVGGAANVAMGGKFSDGFLSAAAGAAAGNAGLLGPQGGGFAGLARRTITAGVIGGTTSVLGGGKFANGAYTAAFQHLLNAEMGQEAVENLKRLGGRLRGYFDRTSGIIGLYDSDQGYGIVRQGFESGSGVGTNNPDYQHIAERNVPDKSYSGPLPGGDYRIMYRNGDGVGFGFWEGFKNLYKGTGLPGYKLIGLDSSPTNDSIYAGGGITRSLFRLHQGTGIGCITCRNTSSYAEIASYIERSGQVGKGINRSYGWITVY